MNERGAPDRFISRSHWMIHAICYLLIFGVGFRRINELEGSFSIGLAVFLLALFTSLYSGASRLLKRYPASQHYYFAIQMIIIQILGVFEIYQDTWSLLYIVLGFEVGFRCVRKEAIIWWSLFATSILVTLVFEFGPVSGLGRALMYIVFGIFMISYDVQYAWHEDALDESQVLLAELREAHQKLEIYAAQADKLAAAQERNRIIRELYDSVGQKIFGIQLAAEATRLSLNQDPQGASGRLDDLQFQTQSALGQMRQLIGQWRPG